MNIAIVHEFLITWGGSDLVVKKFGEIYPEAPIYTALYDEKQIGKWFEGSPTKRDKFLADFDKPEHRGLRDLGRTPLLLGLLCLAFDETMAFPQRRAEIYQDALDALLKKWDASRDIHRDQ